MLLKHALKNAGMPIVTVMGIGIALLIGGVVITETVFNMPGIGRLVVDAISKRDYPIIQGVILLFSGVYVHHQSAGRPVLYPARPADPLLKMTVAAAEIARVPNRNGIAGTSCGAIRRWSAAWSSWCWSRWRR